jgi:hypothetical protein
MTVSTKFSGHDLHFFSMMTDWNTWTSTMAIHAFYSKILERKLYDKKKLED